MENRDIYFNLIDKHLEDEDVVKQISILDNNCRLIYPGQCYTLEYQMDRLNLLINDKGRIIAVFHG